MSVSPELQAQADALYASIRSCPLCPLSETRTNAVPGEGPIDADIMFIGEAPGANEDKAGRPFVGAAGKFLDELLAAAGVSRETVYICNVLKCRPPANRDPLPNEIEACLPYLQEQTGIVDPKVIVTLGRHSMARFFPAHKISAVHGRWKEVDGRFFVPMYHPAAALHQQSLRETILNDFRGLPRVLARARQFRDQSGFLNADPAPPVNPPDEPETYQPPKAQMRLFE